MQSVPDMNNITKVAQTTLADATFEGTETFDLKKLESANINLENGSPWIVLCKKNSSNRTGEATILLCYEANRDAPTRKQQNEVRLLLHEITGWCSCQKDERMPKNSVQLDNDMPMDARPQQKECLLRIRQIVHDVRKGNHYAEANESLFKISEKESLEAHTGAIVPTPVVQNCPVINLKGFVIGPPPGSGKSAICCWTFSQERKPGEKAYVFCDSKCVNQWLCECKKWIPDVSVGVATKASHLKDIDRFDIFIVSRTILTSTLKKKAVRKFNWYDVSERVAPAGHPIHNLRAFVFWDEADEILIAKAMGNGKGVARRQDLFEMMYFIGGKIIVMVSGTPELDDPTTVHAYARSLCLFAQDVPPRTDLPIQMENELRRQILVAPGGDLGLPPPQHYMCRVELGPEELALMNTKDTVQERLRSAAHFDLNAEVSKNSNNKITVTSHTLTWVIRDERTKTVARLNEEAKNVAHLQHAVNKWTYRVSQGEENAQENLDDFVDRLSIAQNRMEKIQSKRDFILEQLDGDCPICMEPKSNGGDMAKLPCNHAFCEPCIKKYDGKTCPVCRRYYNSYKKVSYNDSTLTEDAMRKRYGSKIFEASSMIKKFDTNTKVVLFAADLTVCALIEQRLTALKVKAKVLRHDAATKTRRLKDLHEGNIQVLIISQKDMSGLDLFCVSEIVFLHPLIGEYAQNRMTQAVARAQRIGQKNIVNVRHMVCSEEEIELVKQSTCHMTSNFF